MSFQDITVILTAVFFVGTLAYISYVLYKDPIDSKKT